MGPAPGRWAITGAGLVSAAGDGPEPLVEALERARPLAAPLCGPAGPGVPCAPVKGFDARQYLDRRGLRDLSRTSQLAVAAAARLAADVQDRDPARIGVVLGSAWGGFQSVVDFEEEARTEPPRFLNPLLFAETVANVPAGQVSIFFGWSAFNVTVSCGSASGLEAIRQATRLLEEGRGEIAVAGGADELNPPLLRALAGRGRIARREGSVPFSPSRAGPACGEGACLVSIEPEAATRARGARPLALVRATAARHAPGDGERAAASLVELLEDLLESAGLAPGEVHLVVSGADGSVVGDRLEAEAIHRVFGAPPHAPPLVVPKAVLGETWGAAGALAVVAAARILSRGRVPAVPPELRPEPGLPTLHLPREPLGRPLGTGIVLARGSAGEACGLVLCRSQA